MRRHSFEPRGSERLRSVAAPPETRGEVSLSRSDVERDLGLLGALGLASPCAEIVELSPEIAEIAEIGLEIGLEIGPRSAATLVQRAASGSCQR